MVPHFTITVNRLIISKHVWMPFFFSLISFKSLLRISCPWLLSLTSSHKVTNLSSLPPLFMPLLLRTVWNSLFRNPPPVLKWNGGVLNRLHLALEQDPTSSLFVKYRYSSLRVMLSLVGVAVGAVNLGEGLKGGNRIKRGREKEAAVAF